MALAEREIKQSKVLTYEEYLNEGETPGRYEILGGVREYMTNPAPEHQLIQGNLFMILKGYEEKAGNGIAFIAPFDVLVSKSPLQVREPDLLYISFDRWSDRDVSDPAPHHAAPELVIEILSPNESRRQVEKKIGEYGKVGVLECWLISPQAATIEVLKLTASGAERVDIFAPGQSFESVLFPDLSVDVARVFKLPKRGV